MDIFIFNVIELHRNWPIFSYIEFASELLPPPSILSELERIARQSFGSRPAQSAGRRSKSVRTKRSRWTCVRWTRLGAQSLRGALVTRVGYPRRCASPLSITMRATCRPTACSCRFRPMRGWSCRKVELVRAGVWHHHVPAQLLQPLPGPDDARAAGLRLLHRFCAGAPLHPCRRHDALVGG